MTTPAGFDLSSALPPDLDLAAIRGGSTIIVLTDGTVLNLRYDFDSLAALEEQYGTLGVMQGKIKEAPFTHLPNVLAAGLRHTGSPDYMNGTALRRSLDLQQIQGYTESFAAAFIAAFGSLIKADPETPADPPVGAQDAPSRGDAGSVQPSSTSASAPPTSGP